MCVAIDISYGVAAASECKKMWIYWERQFCFCVVALVLSLITLHHAGAELSRKEKQAIFDWHNCFRASLGRNQLV